MPELHLLPSPCMPHNVTHSRSLRQNADMDSEHFVYVQTENKALLLVPRLQPLLCMPDSCSHRAQVCNSSANVSLWLSCRILPKPFKHCHIKPWTSFLSMLTAPALELESHGFYSLQLPEMAARPLCIQVHGDGNQTGCNESQARNLNKNQGNNVGKTRRGRNGNQRNLYRKPT